MKMAPISPNFMSIVRLLTTKFVKIGSHFHEISLRSPNYQIRSEGGGEHGSSKNQNGKLLKKRKGKPHAKRTSKT